MIDKVASVDSYLKLSFIVLMLALFMPLYGFMYLGMIVISICAIIIYVTFNQIDVSFLGHSKSTLFFFLIYLIYPIITIFWAESFKFYYSQIRFTILHFLIYFITYFFLIKIFPNQKLFLKIIIGIGVIYILTSLWELATSSHLYTSKYYGTPIPIPTGFYYNENNQNIVTSMMLPYAGYFFLTSKKFFKRFFYLFVMLMFVIISAAAGARISMAISVPFLIYILIRKRSLKLTGAIIIAMVLAYSFVSIYKAKELRLATAYLKHQYESIDQEVNDYRIGSTKIRVNMIKNTIKLFEKSNFVGVGAGNYDYHTKQGDFSHVDWIENSHTYFFELLANYGLFLVIPFILLLVGLFKNIFLIYKGASGNLKILAEMNMIQIPIFFAVGFIPSSFFPIFQVWVFIGYLSAFIYVNRQNRKDAKAEIII
ncbi:MAG: O-antigen ligase family protein [Candidatus Cloacimonadales bacterium]